MYGSVRSYVATYVQCVHLSLTMQLTLCITECSPKEEYMWLTLQKPSAYVHTSNFMILGTHT